MASQIPKTYTKFKTDHHPVAEAYERMGQACAEAGPLTDRERALVKIGISTGARLEGGLHSHVRKALEAGVEPAAIRHAVLLALPTMGLPAMMAALTWAEDVLSGAKK
jgi:alkylhydroperoxidase/carboxymuconolactone decarboxylase family protein YurZ